MAKKKKIIACFCLHCHHDVLLEWCYDYDERVRFIKKCKPVKERKKRLKWFQPVKGKLPVGLIKARKDCEKAKKVEDKAWKVYQKAAEAKVPYAKERAAWKKTVAVKDKPATAYYKAIHNPSKAIEKLHAKECPDCTWNGKELVF